MSRFIEVGNQLVNTDKIIRVIKRGCYDESIINKWEST